jgi:hypothetical protein
MELLQGEPARFQRTITEALQEIRHARLMLEALFELTTGTWSAGNTGRPTAPGLAPS